MQVISVGRSSTNDVVIKGDDFVSRDQHCLITKENGTFYIFDANSKNGTYVNGSRISKATKMRLQEGDIVRIGNTVLQWQSYFEKERDANQEVNVAINNVVNGKSSEPKPEATTLILQAIALALSLVGAGMIVYVAIKILSWGILGYAFNYTIGLVGAGCSLVALILAEIADSQEKTDNTTMAIIAEWISSICLIAVVAFFITWKVNPNMMNPFSDVFK